NKARDCNRRTEIVVLTTDFVPSKGNTNAETNTEDKIPCITITELEMAYEQKIPEKVCSINLNLDKPIKADIISKFPNLKSLTINGEKRFNTKDENKVLLGISQIKLPRILSQLTINYGGIDDLFFIEALHNLDSLDLSNNIISDLKPLESLNSVTALYLSRNQISVIDPLVKMEHVTMLDLSFNNITNLSPLIKMKNLKMVNL